jgi:putative addiction module component (TIGR02574 family)
MMLTKEKLVEELLSLSVQDRLDVRAAIDDSLDTGYGGWDSLSDEWRAEIERRVDELDNGTVQTIPAEVVFARLKQRLADMRRGDADAT